MRDAAWYDDVGVFGVVHDQRVEIVGIGEGAAHDLRVGHALGAVGEGDRPRSLEQTDLGHLFAAQPLGQRRHGMHVHDRGVARAAQDEIDDRGIVDRRRGVGLRDDGGDAAGGCRLARRGDGLAIFPAGLADEGAHVDEAGCDHLALAVDDLRRLRHAGGADAALGLADHAIGDQ